MRSLAYTAAALLSCSVALPPLRNTQLGQVVLNDGELGDLQPGQGDTQLPLDFNPYHGGPHAPELIYPGALSRDQTSRRIHSHNDYWRDVPLYTALSHGVGSVEADVWLNPRDDVLYVGHSRSSLTRARTFDRLYISQLVSLIERANPNATREGDSGAGWFNETDFYDVNGRKEPRHAFMGYWEDSADPIQLLVDLKTQGNETYHAVSAAVQPLRSRGWLTRWNGTHTIPGAVTVVLTGNGANLDVKSQICSLNETDIFIDAPLLGLDETWTSVEGEACSWKPSFAPLASIGFSAATSWRGIFPISTSEWDDLERILHGAQSRGFQTRLWSPPRWPVFVRERVWRTLIDLGSDWLDADDLKELVAF